MDALTMYQDLGDVLEELKGADNGTLSTIHTILNGVNWRSAQSIEVARTRLNFRLQDEVRATAPTPEAADELAALMAAAEAEAEAEAPVD